MSSECRCFRTLERLLTPKLLILNEAGAVADGRHYWSFCHVGVTSGKTSCSIWPGLLPNYKTKRTKLSREQKFTGRHSNERVQSRFPQHYACRVRHQNKILHCVVSFFRDITLNRFVLLYCSRKFNTDSESPRPPIYASNNLRQPVNGFGKFMFYLLPVFCDRVNGM